jgi:hypothetical protein
LPGKGKSHRRPRLFLKRNVKIRRVTRALPRD